MMQNLEMKSGTATTLPLTLTNSNSSENDTRSCSDVSTLRTEPSRILTSSVANMIDLDKNFVRWLCFEIFRKIVTIIPLLEDYTCPVCATIIWKPGVSSNDPEIILTIVRLNCGHLFCLSCMVHLRKTHHKNCPICRENVVLQADSCTLTFNRILMVTANLDVGMMNFLKLYFPEEVRTKQKAVERRLLEQSVVYNQFQCNIA